MEPSTLLSNPTPATPQANDYNDPVIATQAKNLTKAIFQHESGMNYNIKGDAGTSSGAGQWQADTWKAQAQDVLGDPNAPMTPENQNVVAQGTIRKLIKEGKNAAQIAAIWNSGSDKNWENKVGVTTINGQQIKYNVPKYVKEVTDLYQQMKAQGDTQQQGQPGISSQIATSIQKPFIDLAATPVQALRTPIANAAEAIGGPLVSALSGGKYQLQRQVPSGQEADPYAQGVPTATGQSEVNPLSLERKAGSALQVGSYLIPGGEGIGGLLGASAMGVAQGAGEAMSQGKEAGSVVAQGGIGGILGAGGYGVAKLGGNIAKAIGGQVSGKSTEDALQGVKTAYSNALNLTANERGVEARTGKDLAEVLLRHDAPLGRYENGTLDTSKAIPILQEKLTPLDSEATAILGGTKAKVNLFDAASQAKQAVNSKSIPALDKAAIIKNIDRYTQAEVQQRATQIAQDTYGQSLESLNNQQQRKILFDAANPHVIEADKIKTGLWNAVGKGFDRNTQLGENATYQLGHAVKQSIENAVPSERLAEINSERGTMIDAIRRLTKLDGVRGVRGGRLGNYFGNLIGTVTGSTLGPAGALAGDYFGGKAAQFLNNPATQIALAKARAGATQGAGGLMGQLSAPAGGAISGVGNILSKGARGAGLLGSLLANQVTQPAPK